jgi:GT2 family glycosyltransferase
VLYKAETLKKIGLFDEFFWMYAEDQDLGWRIWLQGEECLLAEKATVYHDYEFSRSIKKYFWMNRNRLLVILKNYHYLTLIAIAPAWLIMEIGQLFFAWRGGWLKLQIAVYWSFFKPSLWRYLARARQKVQTSRKVKDSQIKYLLQSKISYQEIDSSALRLANLFFNLYWRLVKPMIIW